MLYICEEVLYKNLKDYLTYQMIFEISNNFVNYCQRQYNISSLPDKTLEKLAIRASEIILQQLDGQIFFKFDNKKVQNICHILSQDHTLQKICNEAPSIISY